MDKLEATIQVEHCDLYEDQSDHTLMAHMILTQEQAEKLLAELQEALNG